MLKNLRDYLANTSEEQKDRDWAAVKALGLRGPTVEAFLFSFRQTPVFQSIELDVFQESGTKQHLTFEFEGEDNLYTLAA